MTQSADAPRDPQLLNTVYRSASWARIALTGHVLIVNALRIHQAQHPIMLAVATGIIIGWSIFTIRCYRRPDSRMTLLIVADLILTVLLVSSSRFILGEGLLQESFMGVGTYWTLIAPIMLAVYWGKVPGALAGAAIGVLQFVQEPSLSPRAWSIMLLVVAIPYFIGLLVSQLNITIAERDRNYAIAAALEERERLNRIVHDGVLQVLAMVAREGNELGPRGRMLSVLARKQEDQLRAILQDRSVDTANGRFPDLDKTDLTTMLGKHQSPTVTVSTMAGQVLMGSARAKELDAVIVEVLSNVFKHAGVDARSWILLEQEGDEVIISVRDDGVGMSKQQLEAAADAGRLGVKESIVGRVIDLRGTSTLHSAPGEGTEWEFRLPLE